jgi:cytidylate kinase
VGKSTVAKYLATRWGFLYLNTGRHYRAVAWLAFDQRILHERRSEKDPFTSAEIEALSLMAADLKWEYHEKGVMVNGRFLSQELHTTLMDYWSSRVSEIPKVRQALNSWFRQLGTMKNIVAEGRDTTSAIFPEAEVRIFLDASPEKRALRRSLERRGNEVYQETLQAILERDEMDRTKPVGALVMTPGCHVVDTSDLTIEQVYEKVDEILHRSSFNF